MAGWNTFVKDNSDNEAKYTKDTKTAPAATATTAETATYHDDLNHKGKYTYFVTQDTISATNPNPNAKLFPTWHAASLKKATTEKEVEALKAADNKLLTDANKNQKIACAAPAATANANAKKLDADNCTAAKARVEMVKGWVSDDDAALKKLSTSPSKKTKKTKETLAEAKAALAHSENLLKKA